MQFVILANLLREIGVGGYYWKNEWRVKATIRKKEKWLRIKSWEFNCYEGCICYSIRLILTFMKWSAMDRPSNYCTARMEGLIWHPQTFQNFTAQNSLSISIQSSIAIEVNRHIYICNKCLNYWKMKYTYYIFLCICLIS